MKNKTVDEYLDNTLYWKESLNQLRKILLSTGLEESLKWGVPTYSYQNKNIVGIGAFKSYFGLWFFQGALLKDKGKLLINAQEGKTNALRQWRFKAGDEINTELIQTYIFESIRNFEQGIEIKPNRKKPIIIPDEILSIFKENRLLQKSFDELSLSKRREYADYITEAKRESTKQNRLQKITPMILAGKGLHDKYKKGK